MILVDTSVWIEFFAPKARRLEARALDRLEGALRQGKVATLEPIRVELLSGRASGHSENRITRLLDALEFRDLAWTERKTWDRLIGLAELSYRRGIPAAGLVDRMIALAAAERGDSIWTLDRTLLGLARAMKVDIFD